MPWGVVAAAVIGAYSASKQSSAAKKGADAQAKGAADATAETRREYDQSRTDQLPWLQAGTRNLAQLEKLNSGDYSSFHASPDYQFTLDQGIKGLDRSAAAHGRLYSGGYGEDLTRFGQGLAETQYNNYYNKIAGVAGVGQNAAQNLGALGANASQQIGANYRYAGDARASGYAGSANAWSNYANQLGGMAGQYAGSRGYGSGSGGGFSGWSGWGGG